MILNGRKVAKEVLIGLKEKIQKSVEKPTLAVIIVGSNPSSISYVNRKVVKCEEVGINSMLIELAEDVSEKKLLSIIEDLNNKKDVDGILVQLPLPKHINPLKVTETISYKKDVDGFHPINMGKLLLGYTDGFIPCTPLGIKTLLDNFDIPLAKKHVVIVGRSNIVGKPLAAMLIQRKTNATITIAHSYTQDLKSITKTADILVASVGRPNFITADMVKDGSVVIDVGINKIVGTNHISKIVGDVDFENVSKKASFITPVPGGVGPMTIASLMQNTFKSFQER